MDKKCTDGQVEGAAAVLAAEAFAAPLPGQPGAYNGLQAESALDAAIKKGTDSPMITAARFFRLEGRTTSLRTDLEAAKKHGDRRTGEVAEEVKQLTGKVEKMRRSAEGGAKLEFDARAAFLERVKEARHIIDRQVEAFQDGLAKVVHAHDLFDTFERKLGILDGRSKELLRRVEATDKAYAELRALVEKITTAAKAKGTAK